MYSYRPRLIGGHEKETVIERETATTTNFVSFLCISAAALALGIYKLSCMHLTKLLDGNKSNEE